MGSLNLKRRVRNSPLNWGGIVPLWKWTPQTPYHVVYQNICFWRRNTVYTLVGSKRIGECDTKTSLEDGQYWIFSPCILFLQEQSFEPCQRRHHRAPGKESPRVRVGCCRASTDWWRTHSCWLGTKPPRSGSADGAQGKNVSHTNKTLHNCTTQSLSHPGKSMTSTICCYYLQKWNLRQKAATSRQIVTGKGPTLGFPVKGQPTCTSVLCSFLVKMSHSTSKLPGVRILLFIKIPISCNNLQAALVQPPTVACALFTSSWYQAYYKMKIFSPK